MTIATTIPTALPQNPFSKPSVPAADFAVADGLGVPFAPETVLLPGFVPLAFLVGPLYAVVVTPVPLLHCKGVVVPVMKVMSAQL